MIMGISQPDDEVDLEHLQKFRKAGMKIASIGPALRDNKIPEGKTILKEADVHLGLMCDTYGLFAVPGVKRKICPTSGLLLNQMFWGVCLQIAEKIIARTGNTPCVYLSAALKGGRDKLIRNREILAVRGY